MRAIKAVKFPLRTCLFWKYHGKLETTWSFFARNTTEAQRIACAQWFTEQNLNALIFLTNNEDPNCPVSFFEDGFAGEIDVAQVKIIDRWLKIGRDAGAVLVPTLYCDDDGSHNYSVERHKRYFDKAIPFLSDYCDAISISIESNEKFMGLIDEMIAYARTLTDLPIGTHMQWDCRSPLPDLDFLLYEHKVIDADAMSAIECADEGAKAIKAAGNIPVGFVEYNLNPDGERIREQSRALAKLPCVMVGGPV
jgi:hypothetical protein